MYSAKIAIVLKNGEERSRRFPKASGWDHRTDPPRSQRLRGAIGLGLKAAKKRY